MRLSTSFTMAALAVPLAAQSAVVPQRYTEHWGSTSSDAPLGRTWMRQQLLIDRSTLPVTLTAGKTITAIGMRRAARAGGAYAATSIDIEISLYSTPQSVSSLSRTFASNRALGTGGVAFTRKTLNLPAADFGNPTDFIVMPLDNPHAFAGPNLLIEFSNLDTTSQTNGWFADHASTRATGTSTVIGEACGNHGNVAGDTGAGGYLPGSTVTFTLNGGPVNSPAVVFTALSCVRLGPLPLPLDVAFFTAPNCNFYTSLDANLARTLDGAGATQATVPIPADLALSTQHFYTQWLVLDVRASRLEASAARQIHVGPIFGVTTAQTTRPNDNADSTGDPVIRDLMPVLKLFY